MEKRKENVSIASVSNNESSGETMSVNESSLATTSDSNLKLVNDRNTNQMESSEPLDISESTSSSSLSINSGEDVSEDCDRSMSTNQDVNTMSRCVFLKYQLKLLKLERDAELERETMKTVQNGEGMPGVLAHLEVVSTSTRFGKMCVTFTSFVHIKLPSHGLRKGDNVCIFSGGALCRQEDHCIDGVVLEVSAHEILITLDAEAFHFVEDSSYSLKHHPSLENIRRIIRGLNDMKDVSGCASRLVEVLFSEQAPLPPLPRLPPKLCSPGTDTITFFNKDLDASQRESVEFVLKQQDLAVVHGPPGTGKTTALIEIIRQHVRCGVKVLALAPSNLGVDNLVERLDGVGLKVVRVGHPARTTPATQRHTIDALLHTSEGSQVIQDIHEEIRGLWGTVHGRRHKDRRALHKEISSLRKEVIARTDRLTRELMRGADVVLCTLLSAHPYGALRHVQDGHFGLTVIDECSQGTEASCYLSVMRSPKLVMAGDHKQLPPTVLCTEASYLLTSLMERVFNTYGDTVVRMLTVQYRMNTDIMLWSSRAMYSNKLVAHPSVADHLLCHLPGVTDTDETNVPLLLIDTSDCPGFEESETVSENGAPVSKSNDGEAALVLGLVKKLTDAGTRQDQIAVITPYSRQVKLVRALVGVDFPDVEVQTVDGFQGREKEVVILTLVRSNDKGEIGFLAEDRRLNVAVTRARRQLSVVCNTNTLQQNTFLKSFVDYMMEHARVVRAEHMDEGYCWVLSHQSLSVNQLISRTPTLGENNTQVSPPPTPRAKALSPILIGRTQYWDNDVDPVTGLSRGDLIRQYQVLFLYALNPEAHRYRMHSLARSVWDFSDIKDFSVVSNLFQHFCTQAINGETSCFSDKDIEARVLMRLNNYLKQHGKSNGVCWDGDCDEECRGHRDLSLEPCDAGRRRRPRSRSSSVSGSHYRRGGENGKENVFRSNRFKPYWLPQCGDGFQWRRRCNYDRQPRLETTAC